jgi:hypothetical protein
MCEIVNTVMAFFNDGQNNHHHRFKSWENCYFHFRAKHLNNNLVINEFDSLQLGFYLASWGMYRGSSFLLKNSYEIHSPVLQNIFNHQYEQLWEQNIENITQEWINILFTLKESIKNIYQDETTPTQRVSDTLITKIILGVLGITPAYDRFFRDGCRQKNVRPFINFSQNSYKRMIQFYIDNQESFNQARDQIQAASNLAYPPMKLLDMYFWTIGANYNFNQIE